MHLAACTHLGAEDTTQHVVLADKLVQARELVPECLPRTHTAGRARTLGGSLGRRVDEREDLMLE